jgi:hypothetical protein
MPFEDKVDRPVEVPYNSLYILFGIWEVLHVVDSIGCVMVTSHCEQVWMTNNLYGKEIILQFLKGKKSLCVYDVVLYFRVADVYTFYLRVSVLRTKLFNF